MAKGGGKAAGKDGAPGGGKGGDKGGKKGGNEGGKPPVPPIPKQLALPAPKKGDVGWANGEAKGKAGAFSCPYPCVSPPPF